MEMCVALNFGRSGFRDHGFRGGFLTSSEPVITNEHPQALMEIRRSLPWCPRELIPYFTGGKVLTPAKEYILAF